MSSKILSIYDLLSGYCTARTRTAKRAKRRVVDLTAGELDEAARSAFGDAARRHGGKLQNQVTQIVSGRTRDAADYAPLEIYPTSKSISIRVVLNEREVIEDYVWVKSKEQLDNFHPATVRAFKEEIQRKFACALDTAITRVTSQS